MKSKISKDKIISPISVDHAFAECTISQNSVSAAVVKDIKYHFTILNHSMTAWDILKDTWRVYHDAKVEFRHLVSLKPARLIFHELIARMQALIEQEDSPGEGEKVFAKMIKQAHTDIKALDGYHQTIKKMQDEYDWLSSQLKLMINGKNNKLKLDPKEQTIVAQCLSEIAGGKNTLSQTQKNACFQRTLAALYTKRAREYARYFMEQTLEKLVHQNNWNGLPLKSIKESISLFTTGGSASGKTSSLEKVAKGISEAYEVQWKNMSHHNTDRLCTVVFDKTVDPKQYFDLAGYEARLIKERELEVCDELTTLHEMAVDEVDDAVSIRLDRFEAAINKRKAVIVCAISTDTEAAFERAYSRGKQAGRFTTASALLKSHQDAAKSLQQAFSKFKEDTKNVSVLMYDNNATEGDAQLFCTISSGSKTINILNSSQLDLWLKKYNMNIQLGKLENNEYELDLYQQPPITQEDYFKLLINLGYTIHSTKALEKETRASLAATAANSAAIVNSIQKSSVTFFQQFKNNPYQSKLASLATETACTML